MSKQARNKLGTSGVAKSFLRGRKVFKLYPPVFNYAQQIFQGGQKVCRGGFAPFPLVTGLCRI